MNLAHFDSIVREGHAARVIFVGDGVPDRDDGDIVVGMFPPSGPRWVTFTPNPGADTVVVWDDGALQVMRPNGDDGTPPRLGLASAYLAPAARTSTPLPATVASASQFSRPGSAKRKGRR